MALPKKIKKHIPLTQPRTLLSRRYELAEKIQQDGTFLPKSLLHADLDKGFLDFVKDELKTIVDGKAIPMVDSLRKYVYYLKRHDHHLRQNNI